MTIGELAVGDLLLLEPQWAFVVVSRTRRRVLFAAMNDSRMHEYTSMSFGLGVDVSYVVFRGEERVL